MLRAGRSAELENVRPQRIASMNLSPHYQFFGHYVDAGMELELLREFALRIDDLLREASEKIPERDLELPDALAAIAGDRSYLYAEVFPGLLHESFLVSCVIALESHFRTFVTVLRSATGTSVTLNDLSGSTPGRFRTFCEKICHFDTKLSDPQWQSLMGLIEVRNCLVHSSGALASFSKRAAVQDFAHRHPQLTISDERISASRASSELSLSLVEEFVETVFPAALAAYPCGE